MRLVNLVRIGVCTIFAVAWIGCNAILGLELGEPEETGSGGSGVVACGNGKREMGEECDDGNDDAQDGCDDSCQVECAVPDGLEGISIEDETTHHCYLHVRPSDPPDDVSRAWYDALYLCRAHGFDLAAVTTAGEYTFVDRFIDPPQETWIGGNDQAAEDTFEWTTGEIAEPAPWLPGEPSSGSPTPENCIEVWADGLNDEDCSKRNSYVCERHPPGVCGDGVIDAAEECDDANDEPDDGCSGCQVDCENIEANGVVFEDPRSHHCYIQVGVSVKWAMGAGFCGDIDGFYLATLSSAEELAFLADSLDVLTTWIGATDADTEGKWAWANGEPWEFIPWLATDPMNSVNKDCLYFRFGEIIAGDCTEGRPYLCERDPIGRRSPDAP